MFFFSIVSLFYYCSLLFPAPSSASPFFYFILFFYIFSLPFNHLFNSSLSSLSFLLLLLTLYFFSFFPIYSLIIIRFRFPFSSLSISFPLPILFHLFLTSSDTSNYIFPDYFPNVCLNISTTCIYFTVQ